MLDSSSASPVNPSGLSHARRQQLRQAAARHGRKKVGLFLVEGVRCAGEALRRRGGWLEFLLLSETFAARPEAAEFIRLARDAGRDWAVAPDAEFAQHAVTENPQGVLALFRCWPETAPAAALRGPFVLVLDRITEPGNLGTILRTAWGAGLPEVWLTAGGADPFNPKAVRSGMGAQFALELRSFPDLAAIRQELARLGGGRLWCATPRDGVDCFAASFDVRGGALVIGNEADGVLDLRPGEGVTIPMPGQAESLNAAQAATILLFDAVRRGWLA
ncbi:MAG: RNA methyltransferase [Lentisphaeria bacterium]